MTDCARCGDCCDPIRLDATKKQIRDLNWLSGEFILKHWHRISRQAASVKNPLMTSQPGGFFYTCDAFDPITRRCMANDSKPEICSGFPWYTEAPYSKPDDWSPQAHTLYPWRRCSFWADVPKETWPEDVRPTTFIALEDVA